MGARRTKGLIKSNQVHSSPPSRDTPPRPPQAPHPVHRFWVSGCGSRRRPGCSPWRKDGRAAAGAVHGGEGRIRLTGAAALIPSAPSLGQAVDVVVGRAQVGGVLEHHLVGAELLHLAALDQIAGDAHQVGVRGIEAHVVYPKGEGPFTTSSRAAGFCSHIGGDGEDVPHPAGK